MFYLLLCAIHAARCCLLCLLLLMRQRPLDHWMGRLWTLAGCGRCWLRSGAAEDPEELGKIIVKHKRCYATGRWVEKRLGPYADHSLCRPSHVGADGRRRCGTGCC